MYFVTETSNATKLAALDHYQATSSTLFDTAERLINFYKDIGSKALSLAGSQASMSDPSVLNQLVPEFFMGHMRIVGRAHEDLIRLVEGQIHHSSSLAKSTLDKLSQWSPPMVGLAIDTTESIIAASENAADELGEASIIANVEVENKLANSTRSKSRARAA